MVELNWRIIIIKPDGRKEIHLTWSQYDAECYGEEVIKKNPFYKFKVEKVY